MPGRPRLHPLEPEAFHHRHDAVPGRTTYAKGTAIALPENLALRPLQDWQRNPTRAHLEVVRGLPVAQRDQLDVPNLADRIRRHRLTEARAEHVEGRGRVAEVEAAVAR